MWILNICSFEFQSWCSVQLACCQNLRQWFQRMYNWILFFFFPWPWHIFSIMLYTTYYVCIYISILFLILNVASRNFSFSVVNITTEINCYVTILLIYYYYYHCWNYISLSTLGHVWFFLGSLAKFLLVQAEELGVHDTH